MLQGKFRYLLIAFLVLVLILIRAFSPSLFYDPLLDYFKNDYLYKGIPKMDKLLYFKSLFLRYALNSIVSLAIIYLFFKKKAFVRFAIWFYIVAFIILTALLFFVLKEGTSDYKLLFYIRRFLIHPVFLLLLLPAFYQKNKAN